MTRIVKNDIGIETKIFAQTFEHEAWDQIKKLANFPAYQKEKIRVMPDAHAGKGCTIGTTMTITDKVTPNLVGVDIGCGMLTVKLKNKDVDLDELDRIINQKIPSGFDVHRTIQHAIDYSNFRCKQHVNIIRANLSVGSLGGGNHFIEISRSENDGNLYLVIHTGSRKLGADTCKYYQDKAFKNANEMTRVKENLIKKLKEQGREKEINEQLKKLEKPRIDKEMAYLTGYDFDDYINDMRIVQDFAVKNRDIIASIILENTELIEESRFETIHNYIDFDRMILRKGAVRAEKNETLLIPINMRDGSLICKGKENPDWNYSAPHGAGRLMSRKQAKETIDIDEFENSMSDIHSSSVCKSTIDEAPQAYKSIDEIRDNIIDTVDIVDNLKPVYNFKAH